MSADHYWNTCPKCGAPAYRRCFTRNEKPTHTHRARIDGQFGPLRGEATELLDRLSTEPIGLRSLLQAAYDAGWRRGMDDGGWA